MRTRPLVLNIVAVAFVALVAVGCSSTDSAGTDTGGGGTTPPTTATTGTTEPAAGTSVAPGTSAATVAVTITVVDSPLGSILVDGQGMTLYAFSKDTATESACVGGCIDGWPAVTGSSVDAGAGLDADDFTTISGADGAPQIVFSGHPLYTFAGDSAPGDTTGQGIGGSWYVVGADGNPIQTAA